MSILYAISIVYIAGEYDGPGFCTPIGFTSSLPAQQKYTHYYYYIENTTIKCIGKEKKREEEPNNKQRNRDYR